MSLMWAPGVSRWRLQTLTLYHGILPNGTPSTGPCFKDSRIFVVIYHLGNASWLYQVYQCFLVVYFGHTKFIIFFLVMHFGYPKFTIFFGNVSWLHRSYQLFSVMYLSAYTCTTINFGIRTKSYTVQGIFLHSRTKVTKICW